MIEKELQMQELSNMIENQEISHIQYNENLKIQSESSKSGEIQLLKQTLLGLKQKQKQQQQQQSIRIDNGKKSNKQQSMSLRDSLTLKNQMKIRVSQLQLLKVQEILEKKVQQYEEQNALLRAEICQLRKEVYCLRSTLSQEQQNGEIQSEMNENMLQQISQEIQLIKQKYKNIEKQLFKKQKESEQIMALLSKVINDHSMEGKSFVFEQIMNRLQRFIRIKDESQIKVYKLTQKLNERQKQQYKIKQQYEQRILILKEQNEFLSNHLKQNLTRDQILYDNGPKIYRQGLEERIKLELQQKRKYRGKQVKIEGNRKRNIEYSQNRRNYKIDGWDQLEKQDQKGEDLKKESFSINYHRSKEELKYSKRGQSENYIRKDYLSKRDEHLMLSCNNSYEKYKREKKDRTELLKKIDTTQLKNKIISNRKNILKTEQNKPSKMKYLQLQKTTTLKGNYYEQMIRSNSQKILKMKNIVVNKCQQILY